MKVGIPREIKNHEYRVAITPAGVLELVRHGHDVVIEHDAGEGSSIPNEDYVAAGATILDTADEVWGSADMILKVKEPIAAEYHRMREGQVLFTYLHLAADRPLTEELAKRKVTAIAYETVELPDRSLPLLAPMSEVAGRLAPQVGANALMRAQGGRGVLMGGVSGVYAAKVVVIGAGVAGNHVSPPSTDLKRPDPGPPLDRVQGVRWTSHVVANSTSGRVSSIATSTAPASSFRYNTFDHVTPPSVVRKRPRSALRP